MSGNRLLHNPMLSENKQRFYYPELDGLRFIAFLLVFIHHAPYYVNSSIWQRVHEYGWIGVDLFLCLSAFLITKLLDTEHRLNGWINIRNFYFRRILRIWPLYFFIIAVAVIIHIMQYGWSENLLERIIGLMTFTDNVLSAFLGYIPIIFIVQVWTISYEVQFYTIIPWVLRIFHHTTRHKKYLIVAVLALAGNIIRSVFIYKNVEHPAIWVLPFTHFETVIFGIVLGLGLVDDLLRKTNTTQIFFTGIICIIIIVFLPNWDETGWTLILTYSLSGIGMPLILYSAINEEQSLIKEFIKSNAVVYLGKISYGLYIYQLLGLYLGNQICGLLGISSQNLLIYPTAMIIMGLLITISISSISYSVIERPFLVRKDRFASVLSRPI